MTDAPTESAISEERLAEIRRQVAEGGWHAIRSLRGDEVPALLALIDALRAERDEARASCDGAYSERNRCVGLIAKMALALGYSVGRAKTAIEGWDEDWHGCVYIDLPTGQISWHYHSSENALFDFLPAYTGAWDGHDTPTKYERVNAAFPLRPSPADDLLARLTTATARDAELEGALADCIDTLALVEHPKSIDPDHGAEVAAFGERIGYGALMSSASASWMASLEAQGYPASGAFVAGPCIGTVQATLRRARALTGGSNG